MSEGVLTRQPWYWDIWLVAAVWLWLNDYILLLYSAVSAIGSHSSGWYLCQWWSVAFGEITVWVWPNDGDVCNTIIWALCGSKWCVFGVANSHRWSCMHIQYTDEMHRAAALIKYVELLCFMLCCSLVRAKTDCVFQWLPKGGQDPRPQEDSKKKKIHYFKT